MIKSFTYPLAYLPSPPLTCPQTAEDDPPTYTWELTTTAFRVNADGQLVVAEDTLDRDQPNTGVYTFQVVAREAGEGGVAAAPITITVLLNDVNDNPPRLPVYPPVSIQAGAARRTIATVSIAVVVVVEETEVVGMKEVVVVYGSSSSSSIR